MIYGVKAGDTVVLTADGSGKEIIETNEPSVPDGYKATYTWYENATQIVQTWELVPIEGTANEAALLLTKWQAKSLPDEYAIQVPALFDEWISGYSYAKDDRVRYRSVLYKCLLAHVSQEGWTPDTASSLWTKILPGQEGNEPESGYAEWVQPDSTNGYSTGDKVIYNGHLWESIVDSNVDVPGTDNGFRWKDLGVYPKQ